jgi:hypothetical protein
MAPEPGVLNQDTIKKGQVVIMRTLISIIGLTLLLTACAGAASELEATNEAEPVYMQITDKAYFSSLEEMAEAADLIVAGEVVTVELGDILSEGAPPGEDSFPQKAIYTIKVSQVIKGPASDMIQVIRTSYVRSNDELRPISMQGVLPSEVGDEVLWFLEPSRTEGMWVPVSLDGILEVRDGSIVSELDSADRLGRKLEGLAISELLSELDG